MIRFVLVALALICLSGCGDETSPKGRWEAFSESPNWLIAVRLETGPGNVMRASALTAFVAGADLPRRHALEGELKQGIKDQWAAVPKSDIEFHGNTITKKKGYAPQFVLEPRSGAMIFHFYSGGKLTEKVTLRPVEAFAR